MKTRKKLNKLLSLILIVILSFSVFANAIYADEESKCYNVSSGLAFDLPGEYTEFAVWNEMDESASGISKMGFPSYDVAIQTMEKDRIEFLSYRDDINQQSGYVVKIRTYDVLEDLSLDGLLNAFVENNKDIIQSFDDAAVLGYGVIQVKGLNYTKIYFETDSISSEKAYVYLLTMDDGTIHEIMFRNHNVDDDSDYLDELTYFAMSTIFVPGDLMSSIIMPDGKAFSLTKGYHRSLFDFEAGIAEATEYNNGLDTEEVGVIEDNSSEIASTPYQKFISFEFPIVIILVAIIAILLFGVKVAKVGEWQEKPLSLNNSKAIQGFAALAIIIHHLSQELTTKAGVLSVFSEFGVLFVGIFFFFSGYGLYTSLKTKENYLKGFLKKRLVTILVPFYVCIIVFVLAAFIKGQEFSIGYFVSTITGWLLINSHMWYIVEIAVLYVAFFIIYSLIKNRKTATLLMTLFVALLTTGSLLLGHGSDLSSRWWFMGEWWYNTTLTFILGIIISQNEDRIRGFARKFYVILLPVFTALTVAFYYLTNYALNTWSYWNEFPGYPGYKEKFLCLIVQLPWVIFFVITLLLLMMKVKFGNKVLSFIGSISLELYLIHNLFLTGLHDNSIMNIKSASLYITLTILLSIGLATLLHGLDQYIIGMIDGKINCKEEDEGRIHSIDTLRIVMAFLVVTIHMPFNGLAGNVFITYGKIAVPFFLIVCGYMLYRNNPEDMMLRLKKQAKRMLIFYVGSNILYYLAMALYARIDGYSLSYTTKQYMDFLLYNMSPFSEHLWFFGSLLYALVVLMIFNKLKLVNKVMFVSPLLIATYVVLSHLNVAEAYVLRNALLVGLPYTMMGMLIRRYKDKLLKIKTPILWMLALVLAITAIIELNTYKQGVGVPFVSCEILVYVVVLLCLKYPGFGKGTLAEKMGVELSLPIYVLHVIPIIFITMLIPANTGLIRNYGAITVFVITALFAALYKTIKKLIKNKLIKKA